MASNSYNATNFLAKLRNEIISPYLRQLSDDIYEMYAKGWNTDFNIDTGENVTFQCHRAILTTRSPAFSHIISVFDQMPYNVLNLRLPRLGFRAILDYIYSGDLSRIVSQELPVLETYEMASRFEMSGLQSFLALQITNQKSPTYIEKNSFNWEIENVQSSRLFTDLNWECPTKKTITIPFCEFHIMIKVVHLNPDLGYLAVFLKRTTDREFTHKVSLDVTLLDNSGRKNFFQHSEYIFQRDQEFQLPLLVKKELIAKNQHIFIKNDSLTFNFEFEIEGYDFRADPQDHVEITSIDQCSKVFIDGFQLLSSDLLKLYRGQKYADIILCTTSNRILLVHECVVRSRLLVESFGLQEIISNLDNDEATSLLLFMYTGNPKYLEKHAIVLYQMANKLGLNKMKQLYSSYLCNSFSIDNVTERYVNAYLHHDDAFKESALHFISLNSDTVLASENWITHTQMWPDITDEVLKRIKSKHNSAHFT